MPETIMPAMPKNGEITAQVRQTLRGKWMLAVGIALLPWATSILFNIGNAIGSFLGIISAVLLAATTIASLLIGMMVQRSFLQLSRGAFPDLTCDFAFVWRRTGDILGLTFLYFLYSLGYSIVLGILIGGGVVAMVKLDGELRIVAGVLLGLGAAAWLLWFSRFILSYALPFLIMVDEDRSSPRQAMRRSKKLMTGNRMQLARLWGRLFGWVLLGLLTCGIGLLWVSPYIMCCTMRFYDAVRERDADREPLPPYPGMSKTVTGLLIALVAVGVGSQVILNGFDSKECSNRIKINNLLQRSNAPAVNAVNRLLFSRCPNALAQHPDYIILPRERSDHPETTPVLIERPGNHFGDLFHVLTADGKLHTLSGPFEKTILEKFQYSDTALQKLQEALENRDRQ